MFNDTFNKIYSYIVVVSFVGWQTGENNRVFRNHWYTCSHKDLSRTLPSYYSSEDHDVLYKSPLSYVKIVNMSVFEECSIYLNKFWWELIHNFFLLYFSNFHNEKRCMTKKKPPKNNKKTTKQQKTPTKPPPQKKIKHPP